MGVIQISYSHRLVGVLQTVMQHNFFASLIMAAGGILAFHYSMVTKTAGCPIVLAEGLSQTGKSTALKVALALFGKCKYTYTASSTCPLP